MSYEDFLEYKSEWPLWRTLGHYIDGVWVAPISFDTALSMPKRKLDTFFALDNLIEIMKRQYLDKKKKK